jgi:DNA-binding transcriptional ArsR family regulator
MKQYNLRAKSITFFLITLLFCQLLILINCEGSEESINIEFGETIFASIETAAEMDSYSFSANAGDVIYVRMTEIDSSLNPYIKLYGSNGSLLVDDHLGVSWAEFEYKVNESGVYTLLAGDRFGRNTGEYGIFFQGITFIKKEPEIHTEEVEELPVPEIVIVTSVAAGTAILLGALTTDLGKYKFLSFLTFLGPLYLRTVREDVFDNEKRLEMYNHIAEKQPVVYSDIKKSCNLSHGEIYWHSHIMTQLGLIRVEKKGFNLFFKLYGKRLPEGEFVRLTDIQKSINDLINEKPGVTQTEIVNKIGLKQQNISYNLGKLEQKGKIRVEKIGRIKHYYPI